MSKVAVKEELLLCADCAIAAANDDYSGMDKATAAAVRAGLMNLEGYVVVGNAIGFSWHSCECCGAKAGERFEASVLEVN